MATTLTIRDETTFGLGGDAEEFKLAVSAETITVEDLIRARVYEEVRAHKLHQPEFFRGLIQPTEAERTLNGFEARQRRRIDPEKEFQKAIESFNRNGFFMLVNGRQVDELEEEIEIGAETTVTFLKLVPLVGG
jgi:hypothetical protein